MVPVRAKPGSNPRHLILLATRPARTLDALGLNIGNQPSGVVTSMSEPRNEGQNC